MSSLWEKEHRGAVTALGEILLSLAPEGYHRLLQADRVTMNFVGSEFNTLCSLSRFGLETRMVTRVPSHEIGECAVSAVRKFGVDSRFVARGGDRMGLMYLEKGASQRSDLVVYDRKHSAISEAEEMDLDLDDAILGAAWFHTTGITPALSGKALEWTRTALKKAKDRGLTVSFDLNYRSKLWTEAEAGEALRSLLPYVDVLSANEWDLKTILGLPLSLEKGLTDESFLQAAALAWEHFGVQVLTATRRDVKNASDNLLTGMLCTEGRLYASRTYDMHLVNRVGGGDAFTAGIIFGILQGYDPQKTVDLAAAADCLKHTIEGDQNLCSLQEVEQLAADGGLGRIRR